MALTSSTFLATNYPGSTLMKTECSALVQPVVCLQSCLKYNFPSPEVHHNSLRAAHNLGQMSRNPSQRVWNTSRWPGEKSKSVCIYHEIHFRLEQICHEDGTPPMTLESLCPITVSTLIFKNGENHYYFLGHQTPLHC